MRTVEQIRTELATQENAVESAKKTLSDAAKAKRVAEQKVYELKTELLNALTAQIDQTKPKGR